jgi:hypothetical protein
VPSARAGSDAESPPLCNPAAARWVPQAADTTCVMEKAINPPSCMEGVCQRQSADGLPVESRRPGRRPGASWICLMQDHQRELLLFACPHPLSFGSHSTGLHAVSKTCPMRANRTSACFISKQFVDQSGRFKGTVVVLCHKGSLSSLRAWLPCAGPFSSRHSGNACSGRYPHRPGHQPCQRNATRAAHSAGAAHGSAATGKQAR